MARQFAKDIEPDKPSNFCGKCRKWIESNERVNLFTTEVDGKEVHPKVWNCPGCRNVTVANNVVDIERGSDSGKVG